MPRTTASSSLLAAAIATLFIASPVLAAQSVNPTSSDADYNTAGGTGALANTVTTGSGAQAAGNTAFGYNSLNQDSTGKDNTASGDGALGLNTTGSNNTASGVSALYSNTTGSYNTASGEGALFLNTTGSDNTASGALALEYNKTGRFLRFSGHPDLTDQECFRCRNLDPEVRIDTAMNSRRQRSN